MEGKSLAKVEREVFGLITEFESAVNAAASAASDIAAIKSRLSLNLKVLDQYQSSQQQKVLQAVLHDQANAQARIGRLQKRLKGIADWLTVAVREEKSSLNELQKGRSRLNKSSHKPTVKYRAGENAVKRIISRCNRLRGLIDGTFRKAKGISVWQASSLGLSTGLEDVVNSSTENMSSANFQTGSEKFYGLPVNDGYTPPLEEQKERLDVARYGNLLDLFKKEYLGPYIATQSDRRGSPKEKAEMGTAFLNGGVNYTVPLPKYYQKMIAGVSPTSQDGRYTVIQQYG